MSDNKIQDWFNEQNLQPVQDRNDMIDYQTSYNLYTEADILELLPSYAEQHLEDVLEEVEKEIYQKSKELAQSSQLASNHKYDYQSVQEGAEKGMLWLLNLLKQRK